MHTHHTKQTKNSNQLQCGNCQTEFSTLEDFLSHNHDFDCPIRCLECYETFDTKLARAEHMEADHVDENEDNVFMELNNETWRGIKDKLKDFNKYREARQKGEGTPRVELEDWIEANTAWYELGRSSTAMTKARAELGQWYTIFTTFAPKRKIPDHPCTLLPALLVIDH